MKKLIVILSACIISGQVIAQSLSNLQNYQQRYKDADAVFIKNDRSVKVSLDKGNLSIYQDDFEDLILLGNNVNKYAESTVGYSGLIDLVDLDAKTLVPDKNKYRTEPARNIVTEQSLSGSIFYDDYKDKRIYFNGLQPGARRIVSSRQQVKLPQLLPPFFFQSYAPCEKSTFEISVPAGVDIDYNLYNATSDEVKFSTEQKKDEKIYRWEYSNVSAITYIDDDAPGIRYFMPHIIVRVKDYDVNGKRENVLKSPADLYQWYYSFIKNINYTSSATLKSEVDSLTHGSKTDADKAKQIYYWVQDHIRYVAFEAGMEGFIPRQPDSVCDKKYGDCKDMATILTSMLRMAGLNANPTWIGTRDIPYTYEQLPSPLVDNHMISALKLDDKYYFLDATSKYLTFGYPSSFIQGKEALIAIDSSNFKIEKVPETDANRNITVDSFRLSIDQRLLRGDATERLTGYDRQNFSYFLGSLESDNFRKAIEAHMAVGNNKFFLDTFQIINRDHRDKDLIVKHQFHIADYVQQVGDETYVNLNLDRLYYNDVIDTATRKLDREEEYKSVTKQHYELDIPKGYQVEYLPPSKSFHDDLFSFDLTYNQTADKISLDKTVTTNYLLLKKEDFPRWNAMIRELNKAYNEAIILKKKA